MTNTTTFETQRALILAVNALETLKWAKIQAHNALIDLRAAQQLLPNQSMEAINLNDAIIDCESTRSEADAGIESIYYMLIETNALTEAEEYWLDSRKEYRRIDEEKYSD